MPNDITVRSIRADELDAFGNAGQGSDFWDRFRLRRQAEWDEGRSSPDLCFVAEADGEILGRLVFSGEGDLALGFFEVLWGRDDYMQLGRALLQQSAALLLGRGHCQMSLQVGSEVPNSEKRRRVLQEAGVGLYREKVIFVAPDAPDAPEPTGRLRYEGLESLGTDPFIEAIVSVNEGALDSDILIKHRAASSAAAKEALAREQFDDFASGYRGKQRLWELAFHQDTCVGLSMPGLFPKDAPDDPESGTICYVGVAAAQRGNGYGRDILLHLTRRLRDAGAQHVWADTESTNAPMISTFAAAGWLETGRNFQYRAALRDLCA